MKAGTYVLLGQQTAMEETFGSTCHGAGRMMSRTAASRKTTAPNVKRRMAELGIVLFSGSDEALTEETPEAYKDIDSVIDVVSGAGLSSRVAKLTPIGVVKG